MNYLTNREKRGGGGGVEEWEEEFPYMCMLHTSNKRSILTTKPKPRASMNVDRIEYSKNIQRHGGGVPNERFRVGIRL